MEWQGLAEWLSLRATLPAERFVSSPTLTEVEDDDEEEPGEPCGKERVRDSEDRMGVDSVEKQEADSDRVARWAPFGRIMLPGSISGTALIDFDLGT